MQINGSAFFKQSFELKIKGDLIPEAAAKEILDKMLPVAAGVQTKLGRGGTGEEGAHSKKLPRRPPPRADGARCELAA